MSFKQWGERTYSTRTVITPNSTIDINQLGVPIKLPYAKVDVSSPTDLKFDNLAISSNDENQKNIDKIVALYSKELAEKEKLYLKVVAEKNAIVAAAKAEKEILEAHIAKLHKEYNEFLLSANSTSLAMRRLQDKNNKLDDECKSLKRKVRDDDDNDEESNKKAHV
jgi:queuine/archaeosine tRNA-ribosyltransferase